MSQVYNRPKEVRKGPVGSGDDGKAYYDAAKPVLGCEDVTARELHCFATEHAEDTEAEVPVDAHCTLPLYLCPALRVSRLVAQRVWRDVRF
jgi:hypothetical protein